MFASGKFDADIPIVEALAAAKARAERKIYPQAMIAQVEKPYLIFGELTPGGNLRYFRCRATAQELASPSDLPTAKALSLIEQITSYALPILILSGGEPLSGRGFDARTNANISGLLDEGLFCNYESRSNSLWAKPLLKPTRAPGLALEFQ